MRTVAEDPIAAARPGCVISRACAPPGPLNRAALARQRAGDAAGSTCGAAFDALYPSAGVASGAGGHVTRQSHVPAPCAGNNDLNAKLTKAAWSPEFQPLAEVVAEVQLARPLLQAPDAQQAWSDIVDQLTRTGTEYATARGR